MHRFSPLSCLVLLFGLATTTMTRASDVHELEALLRRVEVGVSHDDEVVALLRGSRNEVVLSAALREAVDDARGTGSPRRAATALAAFVVVDPARAPGELVRALSHPCQVVRVAALALLGDLVPQEPTAPVRAALLERATQRARPREAALAIAALGTWGEPATCMLPILEAVERDPSHTDVALGALAKLVGTDAGDLSAWWRVWAASAPLWSEHEVLLTVVDEGDPTSVVAALEKLARLPDARTVACIERLVRRLDAQGSWGQPSHEQQGVAAARALGALRDPRGEPALQVILVAASASDGMRAHAQWALSRLRRVGPLTARHVESWPLAPVGGQDASKPEPTSESPRGVPRSPRHGRVDENLAAAFAWSIAAVALAIASIAAFARRLQRPAVTRSVRTAEAARTVARALREIEAEPVTSLRQAAPEASGADSRDPRAPEAADEIVHVVLGNSPRWHSRRPSTPTVAAPAAPVDPAWQSVMEGLDELGGNVGRVVARVNGAEEQVFYEAGEDVSLADAMATLSRLRGSLDDVRVELARTGASMVVYTARSPQGPAPSAPPSADAPTPGPAVAAGAAPDLAWSELVTALEELGASIAEVWAQVAGEPERRRWTVASAGFAGALAALGELRPRVVQVGVRLIGGPAELVMFEGPPPPLPLAVDPVWDGLLDALRSMSAVAGLSARLRCPPGAPLTALFPSTDVATVAEALVALEALEPLVAEVRVRLAGVDGELVLLDRDGAPVAAPAVAPVSRVASAEWLELVRAVEEIAQEVEAVVVRGSDGETVVLRADDEGGLPELLASLQALEGTAAHVRVRLAGGGAELVLLDLAVAETPAPASPPMRTSMTWRHVLGSLEAMGEALDAISALVVGADRRLLYGPGTPRSLAQALSELGDEPNAFQDVKVRLKHSPSELTLFDRALAS